MSRHSATAHFHKSKTLDNKYMLGDEIGKGAYGRVYKGLDLENGDFVAIKQVSLENIAQEDLNIIMQEIDLLKNLNHKNIVKYLGSLKTKTHLHIILEYVENGSLANIIKPTKFGPFPEQLVAFYIAQVLEGLVYLHEQGVIHRDIKGANILTTKEGLVKLADFGVATKLTEADVNTYSVVGTPYWMAPEVIEMSGVCAASDIWSVGCTVIELLTCVPPYYDLQPMPALFRIVQDEHPPLPDGISSGMTDFLCQCFKKDAMQRPDARTLLLHPWIQNCRPALQSSLRQTGVRNSQEDVSMPTESSNADDQSNGESPSGEKAKRDASEFEPEASKKELLSTEAFDMGRSDKDQNIKVNVVQENYANSSSKNPKGDAFVDQDHTLASHEKWSIKSISGRQSSAREEAHSNPPESQELSNVIDLDNVVLNGELDTPKSRKKNIIAGENEGKWGSVLGESNLLGPRLRVHEASPQKAAKPSVVSGNHDISRFSDTPGDASLEDIFQPLYRIQEDRAAEASTSASSSHMNQSNAVPHDAKNDLATKLKDRMAQKRTENEAGQRNGGDLLRLMMGVLKDDVIDINTLVFDEKLTGENLFPLQAVEFSKLVGSLKPEESEDVIVSSCQKLIAFFQERPEQKIVFVTQHGLLPLMELLEVPKHRVICSVLQIINQIVKDNTDFQENACLIGLIPVVMNFAVPDRPREVRMQAAYFFQQLCQSSSLTLQMFIACRGIPVLVGFLEPDYAKYREMVHLAIDGMWQIFKLQRSTPRNDFCRIAAKNGILIRLVNTLHSLNEAARLASLSGGGSAPADGSALRPRSGPLDPSRTALLAQSETPLSSSGQLDPSKVMLGVGDHPLPVGTVETSCASASHPQRLDVNQPDSRYFPGEMDKSHPSHSLLEASIAVKLPESASAEDVGNSTAKEPSAVTSKDGEHLDLRKPDSSRAEIDLHRPQRTANSANRGPSDKPLKQIELASNGASTLGFQHDQVRPLLSLLEKEPPSRHVSGQLEYVRHLSGLERHESIVPLLHGSTERKTNGELDFLMAEFAEVSRHGRENGNLDSSPRISHKTANKKIGAPGMVSTTYNDGAASTSGIASQTASGVLSGSGVLNARPGSTTSSGLLSHMVATMNADVAREYLEKVADLLLEFARADTTVKSYMCSQSLLSRLFQMFNKIESPILLKILKCINHLSTDPNCLENLQRADAIKHLIPNLELREEPLISQIHTEVLNALYNLCKINKRRQEQAAENGIIPHLMHLIMSDSPLKQYALPLLCDMAHASRNSREQLRVHGGLDVYLSLLDDEIWSVTALDSLAICLAHDNDHRKVEQALLKKEAVQKLVKFFQCCPAQYFVHILEPFLKIITKSSRINTTLAVNGLTALLIARLDHQDAIARLNLLKLIKAVYEHHPRPKQLIVENDLPQKLQNLIEERRDGQRSGGQVLVKQMATALLKALHINTVL
ncbi:MAP3K epsilon protein kinase 1-like isoform X2 [Magnolia sinica]|uniref:MAP3K epsilon protein kinase 1-like isoform X2 n=1 Tax=Magnolia sinica TaxID=86752 RepID=UPI0026598551|nr:MAP3K epsilon protein kinase 1-like isoform X2 [Magnolia sinica]